MPISNQRNLILKSLQETRFLGEHLGTVAKPGDIYTLSGDLGAGKTTFQSSSEVRKNPMPSFHPKVSTISIMSFVNAGILIPLKLIQLRYRTQDWDLTYIQMQVLPSGDILIL